MNIYIARQPIFDFQEKVFAYELFYRSGMQNLYDNADGDHATSAVLDNSFFSIGLENITNGKLAFVNFTDTLLLNDVPSIFPSDQIAIEILESVVPTNEVLERCQFYKKSGYLLVMDDFIFEVKYQNKIIPSDYEAMQKYNNYQRILVTKNTFKRIKDLVMIPIEYFLICDV